MIISNSESLKIFAIFLCLGVLSTVLFKLLSFLLIKFVYVLFPDHTSNSENIENKNKLPELKKIKVNKKLVVNMFSATVVFTLFCVAFFVLALHLNFGIVRLFMVAASLLGFYLTHKFFKIKMLKLPNRKKSKKDFIKN